jgi:hypothetical protein
MNDKDRLEHIKKKVSDLRFLGDSEGNGEVNVMAIHNDMMWLIEQAEKAEQLQRELQELEGQLRFEQNASEYNFNELEEANKTIDQYEKAIKEALKKINWRNVEVEQILKQALGDQI